jgi:hypothetical protein
MTFSFIFLAIDSFSNSLCLCNSTCEANSEHVADLNMAFYLQHPRRESRRSLSKAPEPEPDPWDALIACMTCEICFSNPRPYRGDPNMYQQRPMSPNSSISSYPSVIPNPPVSYVNRVDPFAYDPVMNEYRQSNNAVVIESSSPYPPPRPPPIMIPENNTLRSPSITYPVSPTPQPYGCVRPRSILFGPKSPRAKKSGNSVKWRDIESMKASVSCFTCTGEDQKPLEEIINKEVLVPVGIDPDSIERPRYDDQGQEMPGGATRSPIHMSRYAEDMANDPILSFREKKISGKRHRQHPPSRGADVRGSRSSTRYDRELNRGSARRPSGGSESRERRSSPRTPPPPVQVQELPKVKRGLFSRKSKKMSPNEDPHYAEIVWKSQGDKKSRRKSPSHASPSGRAMTWANSRRSYQYPITPEHARYAAKAREAMEEYESGDDSIVGDDSYDWV